MVGAVCGSKQAVAQLPECFDAVVVANKPDDARGQGIVDPIFEVGPGVRRLLGTGVSDWRIAGLEGCGEGRGELGRLHLCPADHALGPRTPVRHVLQLLRVDLPHVKDAGLDGLRAVVTAGAKPEDLRLRAMCAVNALSIICM